MSDELKVTVNYTVGLGLDPLPSRISSNCHNSFVLQTNHKRDQVLQDELAELEEQPGVAKERFHLRPVRDVQRARHAEGEQHARPALVRVSLEPRVDSLARIRRERFERRGERGGGGD